MRALLFAAVLLLLGTGCATSGTQAHGQDMPPPDVSGLQDGDHDALPLRMRDDPKERDGVQLPADFER